MKSKKVIAAFTTGILALLYFLIFSVVPVNASSGELLSVENHATIRNNGTVDIKQIWLYDDSGTDGTEHYIDLNLDYLRSPEENASHEYISSYQVTLDDKYLIYNDNWDINSSFDNKAGEYGVVKKDDGVELTFGISKRELNKFTVEYKVHNVIKETEDGKKYLHWSFLPTDLNPRPKEMSAIIKLEDKNLSFDKIYGFNFNGDVEFEDEDQSKVVAEMDYNGYFSESTLNIFTSINDNENVIESDSNVQLTIDEKISAMLDGSDYDNPNEKPKKSLLKIILSILFGFLVFLVQLIPFIFIGGIILKSAMPQLKLNKLVSTIDKEELKNIKSKDLYRREEPSMSTSIIPLIDKVLSIRNIEENILRFYISKWTSEGLLQYIKEVEIEEKSFIRNKSSKEILFKINSHLMNNEADQLEKDIFSIFEDLADKAFLLSSKDLGRLNIDKYERLLLNDRKQFMGRLEEEGFVNIDGKNESVTEYGIEILKEHSGLKNYIKDYTLLNERKTNEIQLWDYLFHYAALYGLAEEFEKELDKLPKVVLESSDSYQRHYGSSNTAMMNARLNLVVHSQYKQHRAAEAQRRRSSGSGGRSSSGGGSGSSGGGSGGGTR